MQFKMKPIAFVVSALLVSPMATAGSNGGHHGHQGADIEKSVDIEKDVSYDGDVYVNGYIDVNANAMSVINDTQYIYDNEVDNTLHTDDASVDENAMSGAMGNVGLNVSAGTGNQQDNSAALSVTDAEFVFGGGSADAEVFVNQAVGAVDTYNNGATNTASVGGNAFANAGGNIGLNVVSGSSNQQKNNAAISVGSGSVMSDANVSTTQVSMDNYTDNSPAELTTTNSLYLTLYGDMGGDYSGESDQVGDVYLDTWTGPSHPSGTSTGHVDVDSNAQGAIDSNDDGGAFHFKESGTVDLEGSFSGYVVYEQTVYRESTNTATMNGAAFSGAAGNIGVNIASGTGNQQSNSLAMSVSSGAPGMPGGEPW